jgi:ribosomal protein L20
MIACKCFVCASLIAQRKLRELNVITLNVKFISMGADYSALMFFLSFFRISNIDTRMLQRVAIYDKILSRK